MKRFLSLFTALASLLAAGEGNFLKNGNFRQIRKQNGVPAPMFWNTSGKAVARIVAGPDGGKAVRLTAAENRVHLIQSNLKLVPGRDYVFHIRYRGAPGSKGLFYVERQGKVIALKRFECAGEWRQDALHVPMPAATDKLPYAVVAVEPGGTLDAADLKLEELPERSRDNLLRNGDFKLTARDGEKSKPLFWTTNQKGGSDFL